MGWPVAASLLFVASMSGQLAPTQDEKVATPPKPAPLLEKVMSDLPAYGENPAPAPVADLKAGAEVSAATVHFAPFVVNGYKSLRLRDSELFTKKAFDSEIFKRYDYSSSASFQHKEDVRLEDMAALKTYADNLTLVGDGEEGRAIRKESNRLFLRTHDPESDYIISVFNPRIR